jgi:hypothetical protein
MATNKRRKSGEARINQVDFLQDLPRQFRFLSRPLNLISRSRKSLFLSITVFALIKSGIWVFPAINASLMIALDPYRNPFTVPSDQYLMTSWVGSFIAYQLGIKSTAGTVIFFLFSGLTGLAYLWFAIKKHVAKHLQSRAILFIVLIPAIPTAFYWIGMDSFTFFLFSASLYYSSNLILTVVVGILLGMQHFEISIIAALSLLVYHLVLIFEASAQNRKKLISSILFIFGICTGKFFLFLIFRAHGILVSQDRTQLGLETVKSNYELIFRNSLTILFSFLSIYWLVLYFLIRKFDRDTFGLIMGLSVPLLIVFFVRDQTRVMHLTSFILIATAVAMNPNQLNKFSERHLQLILGTWFLLPWVWFWGKTHYSLTFFDIRYMLSRIFSFGNVPVDGSITMWPFK